MVSDKQMSFFEHLGELRKRLTRIVLSLLIFSTIGYIYAFRILDFLKARMPDITITYSNLMEPFMAKFKLGILAGFLMSTPVIFYQILAFLSPALKGKERRFIYPMVVMMVVLFMMGSSIGYFYVLPVGAEWLLAQDEGELVRILNVSQFISFTTLFIIAFGVAFETPVALLVLMKLKIVSRDRLRKNWRIAYVTLMIISAMATPDWSLPPMLVMSAFMIFLYEFTLFIARWMVKT